MSNGITYVGLDVHKESIQVAMLLPGSVDAVAWKVSNSPNSLRRLARRLQREAPGEIRSCYEAGPTGYGTYRTLTELGIVCTVIAPSLIPRRPGDRIKTDRRDARKLAELHRADLLTEVHPPNEQDESLRDLCRCRDDVRDDLCRARHRLSKSLLRHDRIYRLTKRNWGVRHMAWLEQQRFEEPAAQATVDSYLLAISQLEERKRQLEIQMATCADVEPYREPVGWLRCFRGIDTVTAVSLVAELHDFRRFRSARALMSYLGLVPSEFSTGERKQKGSITKTGNGHVRRLLVEAAWHHRFRPRISAPLVRRRENQPARVIAIADRAQERLHTRYRRMMARGKAHPKTIVAMARELVGYLWAVLGPEPLTPRT